MTARIDGQSQSHEPDFFSGVVAGAVVGGDACDGAFQHHRAITSNQDRRKNTATLKMSSAANLGIVQLQKDIKIPITLLGTSSEVIGFIRKLWWRIALKPATVDVNFFRKLRTRI